MAETGGRRGLVPALRRIPAVRLLSQRPFGPYAMGNFLSLVGTWMQRLAAGWLVWEWTHSGFWLGMLAAADLLPITVIWPFAGAAADRWQRLVFNRICQAALTVVAVLMAVLVLTGVLGLFGLIALVFVNGCLVALGQPSRMALVQELVPPEDVGPAVALNSVTVNLARLIGPAIAGIMIQTIGVGWVFLANALVTAAFVVILGLIRHTPRVVPPPEGRVLRQVTEGLIFVMGHPSVRLLLGLLFLGGALLRSVSELLPAFSARTFTDTATGLAILSASLAVGSVSAGLSLGAGRAQEILVRQVMITWACAALAVAALSTGVGGVWAAIALSVALGFSISRSVICTQTLVQLSAPDALRGRALSVHGLVSRGSPSIGALAIGTASDFVGLGWAYSVAAITMLFALVALVPAARRASRPDQE